MVDFGVKTRLPVETNDGLVEIGVQRRKISFFGVDLAEINPDLAEIVRQKPTILNLS